MADDLAPGPQGPAAEPATQITVPENAKAAVSVRDAARILASARRPTEPTNSQEPSAAPPPPPAPESAPEADAGPPQEQPGETPEPEAADQPPIEPPASWTTEAKTHWETLPRETQEYIAQRESERDGKLLQSQREAKERDRTLDVERQKMEQARQQYESALPALVQTLQQSLAGEFPDIQTMADVEKLAREDWARYIQWDASQKKLASVASEARAAQERQHSELQGKWNTFASEQDAAFIKAAPEFADKEKAALLQRSAMRVLTEIGFTEEELARNWNGQQALSLRDHRLQLLIRDGVRYREAQAAVKKGAVPAVRAVPPVTRPGAAPSPGKALEGRIKQVEIAMSKTTSQSQGAKLGAELQALRRELASR